jgi:transcriptional repressor NrdR
VVDSRTIREGVRRRRFCPQCKQRFTTYERAASVLPLVVKRDGRREEFDRGKLLSGLYKACAKRPISTQQIERIATMVERQLQNSRSKEIPSEALGQIVLEELRKLDEVAYIRFASVYLRVDDLEALKQEMDSLLRPDGRGDSQHPQEKTS